MQIRPAMEAEFRALYHEHMKRDFPKSELPPYFAVRGNLASGVYDGLFFTRDGRDVGYAIATAPADGGYVLLNFFAMLPEMRGQGGGSQALRLLSERYAGRVLVLEVESVDAAKNAAEREIRERRIRFYERAGFTLKPTSHFKLFGVEMIIMMNTDAPIESVRDVLHALYLPAFKSPRWLRFVDIRD